MQHGASEIQVHWLTTIFAMRHSSEAVSWRRSTMCKPPSGVFLITTIACSAMKSDDCPPTSAIAGLPQVLQQGGHLLEAAHLASHPQPDCPSRPTSCRRTRGTRPTARRWAGRRRSRSRSPRRPAPARPFLPTPARAPPFDAGISLSKRGEKKNPNQPIFRFEI